MKNIINNILLVTLLFSFPLFLEGESTEKKSFIQQIKEKITEEKESTEEKSRIEEAKEKIVKEKKEIEEKVVEKKEEKKKENEKVKEKEKVKAKEKDKYNHDYVNDYNDNKKYYKQRDRHNDDFGSLGGYVYLYDEISVPITNVEYTDYTYINDSDVDVYSPINTYNRPRKIASLNSSVEAAYLGKDIRDTYGVTAKISANLYSLHFNCFYQNIFSSEESLTLYSINGGVSFAWNNFTLTPFLGAFYIEPLEEARFSYGANLQVFLPANYMLDLYTLNSSYGSLNFNNFSASLNYAFYIFNVGLGFNYNSYAGESFSGPFARLSLSL